MLVRGGSGGAVLLLGGLVGSTRALAATDDAASRRAADFAALVDGLGTVAPPEVDFARYGDPAQRLSKYLADLDPNQRDAVNAILDDLKTPSSKRFSEVNRQERIAGLRSQAHLRADEKTPPPPSRMRQITAVSIALQVTGEILSGLPSDLAPTPGL